MTPNQRIVLVSDELPTHSKRTAHISAPNWWSATMIAGGTEVPVLCGITIIRSSHDQWNDTSQMVSALCFDCIAAFADAISDFDLADVDLMYAGWIAFYASEAERQFEGALEP